MSRRVYLYLAAALLVAGAAAWPLWGGPGLWNTRGGGDSPFLLQRVQQLATAWEQGHFPVRWMPDANYGYGYPFFHYYAPLTLYVAAALHRLGWALLPAIQLTQTLGFGLAAGGMFALVWRWQRHAGAAWLASVGYTTAPFHLVNVYVRGDSLAEFWAMGFYPVVLWALDGVLERPTTRRAILLGLMYAGLILSHNISALIFSPFVVVYPGLGVWGRPQSRRALGMAGVGLAAGLALSAWFWWPALAEQALAQLGPVTQGYFHYSQHFRAADLMQTDWVFDYAVAGGRAFQMGLFQTLGALVGGLGLIGWVRRDATRRRVMLMVGLTLLVATVMITPLSRGLWEHLPLLPFTQFPWRFLSIQALATAVAWSGLVWLWPAGSTRQGWAWLAVGALGAAALVTSLAGLRPDYLPLGPADVTPERLAAYEWFTGNIGSTISAEYLPVTVQPRPYTSPWLEQGQRDRAIILSGQATVERVERAATRQTWALTVQSDAVVVVLPLLYWPGWRAERNGEPWPLTPAAGSGLNQLTLPAGRHEITLQLERTPVRRAAEILSLAAGVVMVVALRPGWRDLGRGAGWALLAVLAAAAGGWLWPMASAGSGPMTWDFIQAPYLHAAAGDVLFSNQTRLRAYTYTATETPAGQPWSVTLLWEQGAGEATLALTTPAIHRATADQPVEPFVSLTQAVEDGLVTYTFMLPANLPTGWLLPRLTLDKAHPLADNGAQRGDLFLSPVRVIPTESPLARPEPAAPLWVTASAVQERPDDRLAVQLAWFTATPLSHHYTAVVRLLDSRGLLYAQYDAQPGGNYRPVSTWPAGDWVDDWLTLAWLADDGVAPYTLVASLYDAASGEVVLTRRLGELTGAAGRRVWTPAAPRFTLPADYAPLAAVWGEQAITLRGVQLNQTAETLQLTLIWQALTAPLPDYTHFVHLLPADQVTGAPLRQHDAAPVFNTYPTSQWAAGEVVLDTAILDLRNVAPGAYRLAVGLYQATAPDFPRLPLTATAGASRLGEALLLPATVQVSP